MRTDSATPHDKSDVRAYFELAAVDFDGLYAERRQSSLMRWVNHTFRRDVYERFRMTLGLVQELSPSSILDVGCGSGRYLKAFSESGVSRLVGLDLSGSMLNLAGRAVSGEGKDQIDLHCIDFMDWESDEKFDMVVGMGLYDYIRHPETMLRRMRTMARRVVVVSFPSRHWFRTPLRRVRYAIKKCPVYFYKEQDVRALGEKAGFDRAEVTKIAGAGMDYFAVFWI